MSVMSGIFKELAVKIDNPSESAALLAAALGADPTRTPAEVRKAQADGMADTDAAKSVLLKGLKQDTEHFDRVLARMGMPLTLSSSFTAAAGDQRAEVDIELRLNNQKLLSFKAEATEQGYYLQVEENSGGGGMSFAMMNNKPAATFTEVESELVSSLMKSLRIPAKDAVPAMKGLTRSQ